MKLNKLVMATILALTSVSTMAATQTFNVTNPGTQSFNQGHTAGSFTDTFTFNYPGSGDLSASLISIGLRAFDIDFTTVTLNSVALSIVNDVVSISDPQGKVSTANTIADLINQPGPSILVVNGVSGALGSYGGNFNVAAVPEPETYALMLAGLSLVGFAARRKQQG